MLLCCKEQNLGLKGDETEVHSRQYSHTAHMFLTVLPAHTAPLQNIEK
jgi:hypothetical protein